MLRRNKLLASLMISVKNRQINQQNHLELQALRDFDGNIVYNANVGIIACDESGIDECVNPAMGKKIGLSEGGPFGPELVETLLSLLA